MDARPIFFPPFEAADDGLTHHQHHYTSPMHSQQGANIQGSQTILNANFNYNTLSERQIQERGSFRYDYAGCFQWISDTEARKIVSDLVDHYYPTFCRNPVGLADLYGENSTLTFDGEKFQGSENIITKLTSLPYHQVKCNISSVDHQLDSHSGGILISVFGELVVGGRLPALKFSQTFLLRPTLQRTWYIANDIFKFIPT